jgi:hypothetical protein
MNQLEQEAKKLDPSAYNRLVSMARLQNIRLIDTRYDMKPGALQGDRDSWAYRVSSRLIDWDCNNDDLLLSGTWDFSASCIFQKKQILKLSSKFLVTYRLSHVCEPDAGREFFERVGKFSAYPYFRSTFAMLTQQSGIVLHPLPVISEQPRWITPPAPPHAKKKTKQAS